MVSVTVSPRIAVRKSSVVFAVMSAPLVGPAAPPKPPVDVPNPPPPNMPPSRSSNPPVL
jgi:hypothetical protein